MTSTKLREAELIERFVSAFGKLGHLREGNLPVRIGADAKSLEPLYAKLPMRFPRLYERLLLSYRWEEVDIGSCTLLANPAGPDVAGLFNEMSKDRALWDALIPVGYIQFARGSTGASYDPVCFDTSALRKNRDCRVVRIDHEQILCYDRIKIIAEVAPSFRQLMVDAIEAVNAV